MIFLKSESEIDKMRESAQLVSRTLAEVAKHIEPGVSTAKLDRIAEDFIQKHNGTPAFKGYGPKGNEFPATLCISLNDEVVHGIPSESRTLSEGDIVSIDCGVEKDGFFGDHAYTFAVGECEEETLKLLRTTLESLYKGIEQAIHGNKIGDISNAVQLHCEEQGYGVVRDLVGHGLGKSLHEDPSVPNFGKAGRGERLRSGMTLAIEPMVTLGNWKVQTQEDGWTVKTADGSIAAHYEHDIVVREGKAEILSTFDYIREITKNRIAAGIHG
ncbi:type I methionyl aminopeptidase [Aliifodinibius sp. S!AR15-10]|uniref:type I methionyl aminopeptidase n=1 Tax=Aliifodinibius sp. S!AR15-10 TaxID=2950437 RepID=UPI00286769CE|nr:type I methionyl aminopeptidase [Aliifodinibius sp. S!AR15-10]MDR8394518.1 type I methionyl aminopeptidase [Aliifodinibius sp. S!AR15-10]